MLRLGAVSLSLLVLLLVGSASAQDVEVPAPPTAPRTSADPTADALIEQGISLREQQRDEEAVSVFRRARALEDSARVRTQLGLALLASGDFVESYELLHEVLLSRDPWVEERRAAIESSFASASAHVGIVEISGGEPGAQVSVNGRVVGALPILHPVHALTGRTVIEVVLDGYHPATHEVTVEPGQTARLRVTLVPRAPESSTGGGSDDWILPVAIVGGVLVVAGVTTALAVALQPGYEHSDVGGIVMTLRLP